MHADPQFAASLWVGSGHLSSVVTKPKSRCRPALRSLRALQAGTRRRRCCLSDDPKARPPPAEVTTPLVAVLTFAGVCSWTRTLRVSLQCVLIRANNLGLSIPKSFLIPPRRPLHHSLICPRFKADAESENVTRLLLPLTGVPAFVFDCSHVLHSRPRRVLSPESS